MKISYLMRFVFPLLSLGVLISCQDLQRPVRDNIPAQNAEVQQPTNISCDTNGVDGTRIRILITEDALLVKGLNEAYFTPIDESQLLSWINVQHQTDNQPFVLFAVKSVTSERLKRLFRDLENGGIERFNLTILQP